MTLREQIVGSGPEGSPTVDKVAQAAGYRADYEKSLAHLDPARKSKAMAEYDGNIEQMGRDKQGKSDLAASRLRKKYERAFTGHPDDFDEWYEANRATIELAETVNSAQAIDRQRSQFERLIRFG